MTETTWTELLGGESALLVRLGELIFTWAKGAPVIKVVRAVPEKPVAELSDEELTIRVILEIEPPADLSQDPEEVDAFVEFCRAFVGADDRFSLGAADVKLLTGDLSDYDDDAERAMAAMLALDQRFREWLAEVGR